MCKDLRKELKQKVPRFITSLTCIAVFWLASLFLAPQFEGIKLPELGIDASVFVRLVFFALMTAFLIKALHDGAFFADLFIRVLTGRLHVSSRKLKPYRRVMYDVVLILLIWIVSAALLPLLAALPEGGVLTKAASIVVLVLLLLLIFDVGRVLQSVVEERVERFLAKR